MYGLYLKIAFSTLVVCKTRSGRRRLGSLRQAARSGLENPRSLRYAWWVWQVVIRFSFCFPRAPFPRSSFARYRLFTSSLIGTVWAVVFVEVLFSLIPSLLCDCDAFMIKGVRESGKEGSCTLACVRRNTASAGVCATNCFELTGCSLKPTYIREIRSHSWIECRPVRGILKLSMDSNAAKSFKS